MAEPRPESRLGRLVTLLVIPAVLVLGAWSLATLRFQTELLPLFPPNLASVQTLKKAQSSLMSERQILAVAKPGTNPGWPALAKLADAAPVFAAMGDETRLRIVARLCEDGPQTIVQLTEVADVSRQAITKHLQALEAAGLVSSDREGRQRVWELKTRRLAETRRYLEQISTGWDQALERLRALVETP